MSSCGPGAKVSEENNGPVFRVQMSEVEKVICMKGLTE
jgi:hypothetical protein